MDLYILRHGIAEEKDPLAPKSADRERQLTKEGIRKMRRVARGMKAMDLEFGVILTSPFLRASETAEIVAKAFKMKSHLAFTAKLEPDGSPRELIDEIQRKYPVKKSILLVGHEPYLSQLISLLIFGETKAPIILKKGGLCKLSSTKLRYGRCAALEWLLTPGQNQHLR